MKLFLVLLVTMFTGYANAFQAFSGTTDLGLFNKITCSTGMTCTHVGGKLNIVSSPSLVGPLTLESGEVINNTVDDTVEVISNDEVTTFQISGFEAKNAVLNLWADQGDDAADKYSFTSTTTNTLLLKNDSTTLMSFTSAGNASLLGTFSFITNGEVIDNATDDTVQIASDDNDTTLQVLGFEAKNAVLNLWADQGDDAADKFSLTSTTSNTLLLKSNATTLLTVDSSGNMVGTGANSISGTLQKQVAATVTTITAAQCGSTFYNTGAVQIELPEASTVIGCRLTFVTLNAANFDINPDNADQILVLTDAAGDMIRNATLGNTVTLEAVSASQWVDVAEKGTWADAN